MGVARPRATAVSRGRAAEVLVDHTDRAVRVASLVRKVEGELGATVAAIVLLDRATGEVTVMPHPHQARKALTICADLDWRATLRLAEEYCL